MRFRGRDFALEILSDLSIMMATASRLCEELVLWSSAFVGFIELDDSYCSTSSIMPQKKNPDCAEVMRGHVGTVAGAFQAALVCMKGLPMSYNRDLQTLNPHLWAGIEHAAASIAILSGMIETATFDREKMRQESDRGFSTATELADTLVREYNLPFRTAHTIVGRAVRSQEISLAAIEAAGKEIAGISLIGQGLTQDRIERALDPALVVSAKVVPGGPAEVAVREAIQLRSMMLAEDNEKLVKRKNLLNNAEEERISLIRRLAKE